MSAAEASAQRDLTEATEHRGELLRKLAAGHDCSADLDETDAEIANTRRRLARFAEARAAAARANTVSAKEAAHATTLDNLTTGIAEAEKLVELSKNALLVVAELHGVLGAIED